MGRVLDEAARTMRDEVRGSTATLAGAIEDLKARQLETERVHGIALARVEALLGDLAGRVDSHRRDIAVAAGRDFGTVVRLSAGIEASVADLHALLRRKDHVEVPESRAAVSGGGPGVRHVIYLGGNPEPADAAAAAVLTARGSGR